MIKCQKSRARRRPRQRRAREARRVGGRRCTPRCTRRRAGPRACVAARVEGHVPGAGARARGQGKPVFAVGIAQQALRSRCCAAGIAQQVSHTVNGGRRRRAGQGGEPRAHMRGVCVCVCVWGGGCNRVVCTQLPRWLAGSGNRSDSNPQSQEPKAAAGHSPNSTARHGACAGVCEGWKGEGGCLPRHWALTVGTAGRSAPASAPARPREGGAAPRPSYSSPPHRA